jgi:hypothetical protein
MRSLALLGRVSMCRIFVDYDAPIEKGVFLVEHTVHACRVCVDETSSSAWYSSPLGMSSVSAVDTPRRAKTRAAPGLLGRARPHSKLRLYRALVSRQAL